MKKFNREIFCERIRVLRELRGFSQKEMADAICVERSTYTSYEIGRSLPPLDIAKAVAEKLQVSLDDLV